MKGLPLLHPIKGSFQDPAAGASVWTAVFLNVSSVSPSLSHTLSNRRGSVSDGSFASVFCSPAGVDFRRLLSEESGRKSSRSLVSVTDLHKMQYFINVLQNDGVSIK